MNAKKELVSNQPAVPQRRQAAREASSLESPAAQPPDAPHGHVHRQRDFGIGYGNSSGYGSALHFIDGHVDAPFRFR